MSSPHSESFDAHVRKRVGKACDRCRLKKSKCDGANPCSRCKADNAICVFGERKKAHDKVYPKGYVEMLEQQQSQLVAGLREMYRKLVRGERWPGSPLQEYEEGNPLTHDILERLNVLHMTGSSPSLTPEAFEDNLSRLQQRLAAEARRRSTSTESEEPELSPHSTPGSRSLNFAEDNHSSRSRSSSPAKSHHPVQPLRQHYTLREVSSPDPVLQMWSDQKQWMVQTQETDASGDFGGYSQFYPAVAPVNEALPANPAWMPGWNGVNQMAMGWSGADPDFADFSRPQFQVGHVTVDTF